MDGVERGRFSEAEREAIALLLNKLGISVDAGNSVMDSSPLPVKAAPTFAEYIDHVAVLVTPGTRRAYGSYWEKVRSVWGNRIIYEVAPSEIAGLAEIVRANATVRRNTRGGRSAAESLIAALRCLYKYAVLDGYIGEEHNPAARVSKPRRLLSPRRALSDGQLNAINQVGSTTGNDPTLDALLLRLHIETACRRGGALSMRPADLDSENCLVRLVEKQGMTRWQPVSPTMMRSLEHHHDERGGKRSESLLRYRNGQPITGRRYDYIFERIGRYLPWVATQQITIHWVRYTTLTRVERRFGYAIARAYAGHEGRSGAGTTATYVRASISEVAAALAELSGEQHPLAVPRQRFVPPL